MTKQEIAFQLTLKMLEHNLFGSVEFDDGMTTEQYDEKCAKHVSILFNALMDNLKVD